MKRFVKYEHDFLCIEEKYEDSIFQKEDLRVLEEFYGVAGVPYYNLINRGVKFTQFVGVLQIGHLVIEVLPKADRYSGEDKWRKILIDMLRAVGLFNIHAPTYSSLEIKHNFILDLYISLFIQQVESLLHKGLIKKYHKIEKNSLTLKGSLMFSKQIQKNLVHQERFYVKQTTYDKDHLLHQILFKTIRLLKRINSNEALNSKIGNLLLNFPEMQDIKVTEATFQKIVYNRKTEPYKDAIEIARLLLLNYHPDLKGGQNNVLALMFDMNYLWEAFVFKSLLKYAPKEVNVEKQVYKNFWQNGNGKNLGMKADIVISFQKENFVIDTKWKNIGSDNPSPEDLRQLYVYHKYYRAGKVALVYPGDGDSNISRGHFFREEVEELPGNECSIIKIATEDNVLVWQQKIASTVIGCWINEEKNNC